MRYHFEPKKRLARHAKIYYCDHELYDSCTLYLSQGIGLAVIQQRFDPIEKNTFWTHIDDNLVEAIYESPKFFKYFVSHADRQVNGLYPTVPVRKLMWALRMKPLKKEKWDTTFDRSMV